MLHRTSKVLTAALLFSLTLIAGFLYKPVYADSLNLPDPNQTSPSSRKNIDLPGRGLTMQEVYKRYGNPNEMFEAVGQPPISRWVYKNYTVTFEHEYVIHAVVHRDK